MRSYDLIYIVKPDLDAETTQAVVERVTQRLTDQGASIEHTEAWGKRRMAYAIQRYREGHYVFARFTIPGTRLPDVRHALRVIEDVLRASITVSVGPLAPQKAPAPAPAAEPGAPPPGETPGAEAAAPPAAEAAPPAPEHAELPQPEHAEPPQAENA